MGGLPARLPPASPASCCVRSRLISQSSYRNYIHIYIYIIDISGPASCCVRSRRARARRPAPARRRPHRRSAPRWRLAIHRCRRRESLRRFLCAVYIGRFSSDIIALFRYNCLIMVMTTFNLFALHIFLFCFAAVLYRPPGQAQFTSVGCCGSE